MKETSKMEKCEFKYRESQGLSAIGKKRLGSGRSQCSRLFQIWKSGSK